MFSYGQDADLVLETSSSIQQITILLKGHQPTRELKNFYSHLRAHCLLVSDHVIRIQSALSPGNELILRILSLFELVIVASLATQEDAKHLYPRHIALNKRWRSLKGRSRAAKLDFARECLNVEQFADQRFRQQFDEDFYVWEEDLIAQYPEDGLQWETDDLPPPKKNRAEPSYAVWGAAQSVFRALARCAGCGCHQTQDLGARLCVSTYRKPDPDNTTDFDMFLYSPQALQEAHVHTVRESVVRIVVGDEMQTAPNKLGYKPMVVKRLCEQIQRMQGKTSQRLQLKVERGRLLKLRSERSCFQVDREKPPISLQQLINQDSRPLTEKTKRILAVLLSYAVLHLHGTSWLQPTWDASRILFFQTSSSTIPLRPFIQTELSTQEVMFGRTPTDELQSHFNSVPSDEDADPDDLDQCDVDPDDFEHPFPALVTLAIILMELHFATPFEVLARNRGFELPAGTEAGKRSLDVASIFNEYRREIPRNSTFYCAIKGCLDPNTWADEMGQRLDDEMFRAKVYQEVVRPLEDDLCEGFTFITIEDLDKIAETVDVGAWGRTIQNTQSDSRSRGDSSFPMEEAWPQQYHQPPGFSHRILPATDFTMAHRTRPATRGNFHIAIICALPREADAVMLLFDEFWDDDGDSYGRADGDTNTYMTGRIGNHDVVLAVLPNMGTTSAAAAAAALRSSYSALKLAFLVGICGAVPMIGGHNAFLGDVVVSSTIIQYDYGRQYPGSFAVKDTVEDSLGRANKDIRSLLTSFETERGRERLQSQATVHLKMLQSTAVHKRRRADYRYPGPSEDKLFPPDYTHTHQTSQDSCACGSVTFSEPACTASCTDVGCDEAGLVARIRPAAEVDDYTPEIFIGCLGSGNSVMKSGRDRDRIAAEHGIIAFEMEGAGAWEEVPCVVVKGICDYADSHKNKRWQDFAAATAASVARAMLERYALSDSLRSPTSNHVDATYSAICHPCETGQVRKNADRSVSYNVIRHNARINQGDVYGNARF